MRVLAYSCGVTDTAAERRTGIIYGLGAYTLWGMVPLFWPLLAPMSALEILAHRVVWSVAFLGLILTVTRGWASVRAVGKRPAAWLVLAAVLVSINWGTFIWAVNDGHVVEVSLGYFINPLVSITLGVVLLRERLRRAAWAATGLAVCGVAVLTLSYGRLPWIALTLALSFGFYGLVKKHAGVAPVPALMLETLYMLPVALAFLGFLLSRGELEAIGHGPGYGAIVMLAGPVTAVPLLLFGASANRIELALLGLLQYVGPILQFLLGVFWFGEQMPPSRWLGFVFVWSALVVFSADGYRANRRARLADVT